MKLPRLDSNTALKPVLQDLLAQRDRLQAEPLSGRERLSEGVLAALLFATSLAMTAASSDRHVDVGPALALTVAYAIATRVRFRVGSGFTVPAQLILFPMLFALPPGLVPIFVAFGFMLGRLPEIVAGTTPADRLLPAAANAWHAVGPAAVFVAAGITAPNWDDTPIYVAAFAAQLGVDMLLSPVREWLALGVAPTVALAVVWRIYMVDALLTPIGLFVAFGAEGAPYRALLVLPLVALFAIFAQEREANIETALQLSTAYRGTALLLGDVLEDKDAYTASHSHGVVSLSLLVADKLRLDPAARRRVEFGALLHDIGKIAVPAEIINKPGPLDDDEWAVMKLHTIEGQTMLDRVGGVLGEVGRVVRSSHEHFDGGGYPDGLAGEAIPIESRVVGCCDAFSAMTTTRSYRKAMSLEAAREELLRNSGGQFDPRVVTALLQVLREQRIQVQPFASEPETASALDD